MVERNPQNTEKPRSRAVYETTAQVSYIQAERHDIVHSKPPVRDEGKGHILVEYTASCSQGRAEPDGRPAYSARVRCRPRRKAL
jgi:hypothetical protein